MQLPHTFGRYTLLEKLAQGGMAEVYRARYEGEGGFLKTVAVKRILPAWSEDPHFVAMLIDEANALAHLQHQNIVQVYELGKDHEAYFIAMEFVAGMDCRTLCRHLKARQMRLPEAFAFFIVTEVLKGLSFAHTCVDAGGEALGIVHRDISPQNLLLSTNGEIKIADFGIAKGTHRHRQTQAVQLKGKYAYMAPEQARGEAIDARADLFAVGAVVYELLRGEPCFDGPNDLAILDRVKQAALPAGWERHFPPAVRAILRRALAADLRERYPTAGAFLDDVTRMTMTHRFLTHGIELAEYLRQVFPAEIALATARSRVTPAPSTESPVGGHTIGDAHDPTRGYTAHGIRQAPPRWRGWSIIFPPIRRMVLGACAIGTLSLTAVAKGDRAEIAMRRNATEPAVAVIARAPSFARGPKQSRADQASDGPGIASPAADVQWASAFAKASADRRNDNTIALYDGRNPPSERPPTKGSLSIQARPWGEVAIPGVVGGRETPFGTQLNPGTYLVRVTHGATNRAVSAKATVRPGGKTTCFATFADTATIRCR